MDLLVFLNQPSPYVPLYYFSLFHLISSFTRPSVSFLTVVEEDSEVIRNLRKGMN